MTYFGFLLKFIGIPLAIMLGFALLDARRGRSMAAFANGRAPWLAIGIHVLLAVTYTTPWDNYLVATGVWYYNPQLITGILLGYVPIEEYTFFVVETLLTGLWWWFLARRLAEPAAEFKPNRRIRVVASAVLAVVWLGSVILFLTGWQPGRYLALILGWALPAILLQVVFGADILWHYRRLVLLTILPVFLYISVTDSLAIASGTWTIDPRQSLALFIGSLPVEEALFFLVTVVLIGFGMTLALAKVSQARLLAWRRQISANRASLSRENS